VTRFSGRAAGEEIAGRKVNFRGIQQKYLTEMSKKTNENTECGDDSSSEGGMGGLDKREMGGPLNPNEKTCLGERTMKRGRKRMWEENCGGQQFMDN